MACKDGFVSKQLIRKQPAWCEHHEYRRYVFGHANVKRKRARLDLTSHQNSQAYLANFFS